MPRPLARHLAAGVALLVPLGAAPPDGRAAAHLTGVVKQNQVGGEPMAQVAVSSPDAGGPTASDAAGRFELTFPRLAPGDRVDLDVALPDWVVVNDLQMVGLNLPRDARASPLTVLLARAAERETWARQYYRLRGNETVEAEYRRRLAALEERRRATARERDALARERDQALEQVEELARQLAAAKPGEGDALYRQATQLFLAGRLGDALALLSEQRLQAAAAQAHRLKRDARRIRTETARNYRLRGRLLALGFQFQAAAAAYGEATRLLPDDFQTWFDFARFHRSATVSEQGTAQSSGIPAVFRGQSVGVQLLDAPGYEAAQDAVRLDGEGVQLAVRARPVAFRGYVRSTAGAPIADAQVGVGAQRVQTDAQGYFRLPVPALRPEGQALLQVTAAGYASKLYRVLPGGNEIVVLLSRFE